MNLHDFILDNSKSPKISLNTIQRNNSPESGSYFRPDLDDEQPNFQYFVEINDFYSAEQISDLQRALSVSVLTLPINYAKHIIQLSIYSFDETDQSKNKKILWIVVHFLCDDNYFDGLFEEAFFKIALLYLTDNGPIANFIQALYLTDIITKKTQLKLPYDKALFLLSCLTNQTIENDYKPLIMNIISRQLTDDLEVSNDVYHNIFSTAYNQLGRPDTSLQTASLHLIRKISEVHDARFDDDVLICFITFANSKYPQISIEALKIFRSYSRHDLYCEQLSKFQIVQKLITIPLIQNPNIFKFVLEVILQLSKHRSFCQTIFETVDLNFHFSDIFANQKMVLKVINNLLKNHIIASLRHISENAYDFVLSFLESDNFDLVIASLNIFIMLADKSEISNDVNVIESLQLSDNCEIRGAAQLLLSSMIQPKESEI